MKIVAVSEKFRASGMISCLVISPDDKGVLFAAGKSIYYLSFENDSVEQKVSTDMELMGISFAPDGKSFCAAGYDPTILIFGFPSFEKEKEIKTKASGFYTIQWSPDGRFICAGEYEPMITVISTDSFTILKSLDPDIFTDSGRTCVLFSKEGRFFSTAYKTICLWDEVDADEDEEKFKLSEQFMNDQPGHIIDIALSPNNQKIAGLTDSGEICQLGIWSVSTGEKINGLELPSLANRILWSPDNRFIAVGEYNGKGISFWKPDSLEQIPIHNEIYSSESIKSLEVDSSARKLWAGLEDGRVWMIDLNLIV